MQRVMHELLRVDKFISSLLGSNKDQPFVFYAKTPVDDSADAIKARLTSKCFTIPSPLWIVRKVVHMHAHICIDPQTDERQ